MRTPGTRRVSARSLQSLQKAARAAPRAPVFSTPCTNPTLCHAAAITAVRRLSSARNLSATSGCPTISLRGKHHRSNVTEPYADPTVRITPTHLFSVLDQQRRKYHSSRGARRQRQVAAANRTCSGVGRRSRGAPSRARPACGWRGARRCRCGRRTATRWKGRETRRERRMSDERTGGAGMFAHAAAPAHDSSRLELRISVVEHVTQNFVVRRLRSAA